MGKAIVGIGDAIKAFGGLLAFLLFGAALFANSQVRGETGVAIMIVTIGLAAFAGILLFVLGTLIAAQGQILKATLDAAVNSSPFLTDQDRAEIMSLK
ncbi:MAG: hypothetical protein AABN34_14140 [Acidobacteriota bacterium]